MITKNKEIILKYPLFMYDKCIKKLFQDNEDLLADYISSVTGIEYDKLKDNIFFDNTELPIGKLNEKLKRCDLIVRHKDKGVYNIEINNEKYEGMREKNLSYAFNLYSRSTLQGDKYSKDLLVYQINVNNFLHSKRPLVKTMLIELDTNYIYSHNLIIIDHYVEMCRKLYYNKNIKEKPRYFDWAMLLTSKIEDIEKNSAFLGKEGSKYIMHFVTGILDDHSYMSELEKEKWAEWEKQSIIADRCNRALAEGLNAGIEQGLIKGIAKGKEEGIAQGKKEGIAQGKEENTIEIIKSMLDNNADYDFISKVTNRTIDEIKEIEKSVK